MPIILVALCSSSGYKTQPTVRDGDNTKTIVQKCIEALVFYGMFVKA